MVSFSVGDKVIYEGRRFTVHFISDDLERVTCVYAGGDKLLHSIELNSKLLKKYDNKSTMEIL